MESEERQLGLPAMSRHKLEALNRSTVLVVAGADAALSLVELLVDAGIGRIIVVPQGAEQQSSYQAVTSGDTTIEVRSFKESARLEGVNALENLLPEVDLVVETVLDWQIKLGLSDLAMRLGKALIHSGVVGHRYQIYFIKPGKSACLRCVLPGVGIEDFPLGQVAPHPLKSVESWAGSLMALDAIKYLSDLGVIQTTTLWRIDPLSGDIEAVRNLASVKDCPDCGLPFKSH
ncbi:MAG TPA: hypothetical protein PKD05_12590 [Candidatus Melainabacteria bacterium]|nr:hypothetical protein [Candidatus Melainabacteria bacterium]